jgi:hypothetical protein
LFEAWFMYLNFIFKDIQSSGEQESWIAGGKGQKKGKFNAYGSETLVWGEADK